MLSKRTQHTRVALFVADQVLLAAAFAAAFLLKRHVVLADPELDAAGYLRLYLFAAPLIAFALWGIGLYRAGNQAVRPRTSGSHEVLLGGLASMAVITLMGSLLETRHAEFSRAVQYLFMASAMGALWTSRTLVGQAGRRLADHPDRRARLLVFGMSARMLKLIASLRRAPHDRVDVVGVAADEVPPDVAPRLETDDAMTLLEQGRVDEVLIEAEAIEHERLVHILGVADREGISVHITSSIFPSTNLIPSWERIEGVPLLGFVSAELTLGARVAKRAFDVAVSSVLLVLLAIPLAIVALLIRAGSRGPVLYRQQRVGAGGRTFTMYKFRTMRTDAEAESGPVFATQDDDRCTPLGRKLRRTNIDELPQLFNVLFGHMSLVGPRPERPEFVTDFKREIPRYAHKHWVRPGITGWAQIHGLRGASTSLQERIDHDLYYIEHWSLMLDLRILVRTLFSGYLNAA
ncbi:MAG: exopolysaccharide biosynthesis polyprenyl glycosylphosphotransferase [Planctomycetota bacterium]|jgi:exopolysaccharide biosynthesis polyprenyl glycosylphosphotransferase